MNFKRFNGSTWETVQHKIYGSGTDSLTAFPAMIQASGEPLTDYHISGNTVQNGTPTPEAPVDVVGCGVWDETHQSYKLPITVNGTEYPIYLGQVETTRRIKKLVLTGGEEWYPLGIGGHAFRTNNSEALRPANNNTVFQAYCSHYKAIAFNIAYDSGDTGISKASNVDYLAICDSTINSVADLKTFLAAQYENGTPVTVWYVLAEPETAVVNEPMHKIGNYADTITMAQAVETIPTVDGDNTITFGTYVQPSAMSATFKGWHPVQAAKQYDGNDWR